MKIFKHAALVSLLLQLYCFGAHAQAPLVKGKLGYVIDGDSFYISLDNGRRARVRISGIDSPENEQAFGKEATAYLSQLLKDKELILTPDGTDKQGRMVAKIGVEGKDVAEEMIRYGYAWHYKKYSKDEKLAQLEVEAKQKKAGLWQAAAPVAPWIFRGQQPLKQQ